MDNQVKRDQVVEELEKVIKGLEAIVNDDWMWKNAGYCAGICKDALALLKAQEPRVMTLEEILSSDGAVWILDRDDKGCEIHIAFPLRKRGELDPAIEFRSREPDMLEHRLIRDYLIGWCCWTSRPTDEQRKAADW